MILTGNRAGNAPDGRRAIPKILTNALSPPAVRHAKPGRHADGGGLFLLVKPTGRRSWVYRYKMAGRERDIGLGAAAGPGSVSLADARAAAAELRRKVKSGITDRRGRHSTATLRIGVTFSAVALISPQKLAQSSIIRRRFSIMSPRR